MSNKSKKTQLFNQPNKTDADMDEANNLPGLLAESSSRGWIWDIDLEGFLVACSPEIESLLGYKKDEIEFYEIALEKMSVDDPKKIMHVGDDLYFDVRMAQKIGMTPILFDPRREHDVEDVITIHDLSEVLQCLS